LKTIKPLCVIVPYGYLSSDGRQCKDTVLIEIYLPFISGFGSCHSFGVAVEWAAMASAKSVRDTFLGCCAVGIVRRVFIRQMQQR
jgi:hypothetical protein